jgi:transcription antitermination factor NusG
MFSETDNEKWFALYVKPRHDKAVARLLTEGGRDCFLPVRVRRHLYGGRIKEFELPLFPGYVFCRFDPFKRLPILVTPGVLSIVSIGRVPAPIDDKEIFSLRSAVNARLALEPCDYFHTGQRVRITTGALRGVEGRVIQIKDSIRLVLSITLLQRSVQCEIDETWVTAADAR